MSPAPRRTGTPECGVQPSVPQHRCFLRLVRDDGGEPTRQDKKSLVQSRQAKPRSRSGERTGRMLPSDCRCRMPCRLSHPPLPFLIVPLRFVCSCCLLHRTANSTDPTGCPSSSTPLETRPPPPRARWSSSPPSPRRSRCTRRDGSRSSPRPTLARR